MRRPVVTALVAVVVSFAAACGDDGESAEDAARRTATTVAGAVEEGTRLTATLTGAAEAPSPGDPDGAGTATLNLDVDKGTVCYEVKVQKVDRPIGMHIHEGEAGKSGPVVVPLNTPTGSDTTTAGCANADGPLMARLAANPGNFYVNVHTEPYPQGAVRGQLSQ